MEEGGREVFSRFTFCLLIYGRIWELFFFSVSDRLETSRTWKCFIFLYLPCLHRWLARTERLAFVFISSD